MYRHYTQLNIISNTDFVFRLQSLSIQKNTDLT